jgi:hypothetical protein
VPALVRSEATTLRACSHDGVRRLADGSFPRCVAASLWAVRPCSRAAGEGVPDRSEAGSIGSRKVSRNESPKTVEKFRSDEVASTARSDQIPCRAADRAVLGRESSRFVEDSGSPVLQRRSPVRIWSAPPNSEAVGRSALTRLGPCVGALVSNSRAVREADGTFNRFVPRSADERLR